MSAWRVLAGELFTAGGELPYASLRGANEGLYRLSVLGLAESTGLPGHGRTWRLTQKGRDYCEGRIEARQRRDGSGVVFRPTWLSSLPRGLEVGRRMEAP